MIAKGTFQIQMTGEPPYASADGVTLARARFTKQFSGELVGDSEVDFIGARTPVDSSAGYVAVERVRAAIAGRQGSFVAIHQGLVDRGAQQLRILIVPDSGTGELRGLRGTMTIEVGAGGHQYTLDYEL